MRIGRDAAFHLTYCTNIHPGEGWEEVRTALARHVPPLKRHLAPERPFGIGLRLSNRAACELLEGGRLAAFRAWLDDEGLYVFTLNGFPYGTFHAAPVKDRVYAPDWRTGERLRYTLRLIRVLSALLPSGMEGSISTSPLSYKPWLATAADREAAFRKSTGHLADAAAAMARLRAETGQTLHLALEPEPDCLLENTAETVDFFTSWLFPKGRERLAEALDVSSGEAEEHLRRHVGVCYDTCHFAVEYEDPSEALGAFQDAGIRIGKVQVSAALRTPLPEGDRSALAGRLRPFAESTYLHQVVGRRADGALHRWPDLPAALEHIEQEHACEWRIHYHVPLFVERYEGLHSTRDDIARTLRRVREERLCPHLEIETYTWDVLPPRLKTDLTTSLRREYKWVLSTFASL